ncbi:hypothetical protein Hs30E_04680 [Lactococcus hodotermopsidis]|uniref:Uncharacterized protein n=1 Tax=Pseudolactococcus hodotermopsidis TaxID=2709157 RepID=A0A6A0BDL4_9LACT|nr:hypothetical protein [Lactococcus hodotermopsidis]GFH41917.1 hypothetical protein Hs30E_04680 [Lactococcus hodotermopsidis]
MMKKDKIKLFAILSGLITFVTFYQIVTKNQTSNSTLMLIYCIVALIFNRDKAFAKNKVALGIFIVTLLVLFLRILLARS